MQLPQKLARTSDITPPLRAKLFMNGRSQAVRLPKEFRFVGVSEVVVTRTEQGVLLTPAVSRSKVSSWDELFETLDSVRTPDFMLDREQPLPQEREWALDSATSAPKTARKSQTKAKGHKR
jgi:antitoxin VapB